MRYASRPDGQVGVEECKMFSFNDKIAGFAMIWATLTTGCAIDAVGTDDADLDQVGIDEANAEPRDSTADPLGRDKRDALVASSKSEMLPSKGYVGRLAVQQAGFSQQAPRHLQAAAPAEFEPICP
jgi:hypothetical protein